MFGSDFSSGGGSRVQSGATGGVGAVLVRAQALVDTPRPEGGRPLAWHIQAMLLGDLPALALAAARAPRPDSGPPVD